jgi:iron complex transport system substrate-binding protein
LHIPLFFSEPKHLDDVATSLHRLGTLLGTNAAADAAAAAYSRDIAALRARYAARPAVTMFFQVWDRPLTTLNGAPVQRRHCAVRRPQRVRRARAARADRHRRGRARRESGSDRDDERRRDALGRAAAEPRALACLARADGRRAQQPVRDRRRSADAPSPRIAQGAAALCADLDAARARRPAH